MTDGIDSEDDGRNWDGYSESYFQSLFEHIDSHPDWQYAENQRSLEELAAEAASIPEHSHYPEPMWENETTDGELHGRVPEDVSPYALRISLNQGLGITPSDHRDAEFSPFVQDLADAHADTAGETRSDYLEVRDTPHLKILQLNVPLEYDETNLDEALTEASTVSSTVQELHDQLYSVLDQHRA